MYIFNNEFFCRPSKKYNADPIMNFYQPLYQKAYEIQWKELENSGLKRIVLRLGGRHACMSFLGSIGHFMSSSGLCEVPFMEVIQFHTSF